MRGAVVWIEIYLKHLAELEARVFVRFPLEPNCIKRFGCIHLLVVCCHQDSGCWCYLRLVRRIGCAMAFVSGGSILAMSGLETKILGCNKT